MKYHALIPLACAAVSFNCITVIEDNLEVRIHSDSTAARSDTIMVRDTAKTDTLTEKQKFYRMMQTDGWEFLFNNEKRDMSIMHELRTDYEYKVMPQAWVWPDCPDSTGEKLNYMNSVWRKKKP